MINILKMILSLLLVVVWVGNLVYWLRNKPDDQPVVLYIEASLSIGTYLLVIWLQHIQFCKDIHTSGVLFLFWFVQLICSILFLASKATRIQKNGEVEDKFEFITCTAILVLVFIELCLCFWSDYYRDNRQTDAQNGISERTPLLAESREVQHTTTSELLGGLKREPCPEARAPFLSVITFWWITGLLVKGYKKTLEFRDLTDINERDKAKEIYPLFESRWTKHNRTPSSDSGVLPDTRGVRFGGCHTSIYWAMLEVVWKDLLISGILRVVVVAVDFSQPLLLQELINFVSSEDPRDWYGYTISVAMFVASVLFTLTFQYMYRDSVKCGMRLRSALTIAIYRKALRMSSGARQNSTAGEIANLMSVDTQKIQEASGDLHELWACPVTIIVCLYLLWNIIGVSTFAGVGVLCVLLPINGFVMARFGSLQQQQMDLKDDRLKITNEVLRGIKILKFYAWEPSFANSVKDVRNQEMGVLRKQSRINAGINMAWTSTQFLVSLAVFGVYVLTSSDHVLDARKAFVSISIINILNWTGALLPMQISFTVQAVISVKRISKMLRSEEVDPNAVITNYNQEPMVIINNGAFRWSDKQDSSTLQDVNLTIQEGQLVGVVGQVGSGKSSLINAILGELQKQGGTVSIRGDIAYVPQEAWIQNATLQNNILFGLPYNKKKYSRIVEACSLKPDFKILSGGDQTEIGEKGINLSGGQKQRVSLARAVYQDKDLYVMDDPLSAVDAHVGKHLFEETRILVTHGVTFLPQCDMVVVMKDGRISECGGYDKLLEKKGAFSEFIETYLRETADLNDEEMPSDEQEERSKLVRLISQQEEKVSRIRTESEGSLTTDKKSSPKRQISLRRRLSRRVSRQSVIEDQKENRPTAAGDRLIEEEEAMVGNIRMKVFWDYSKTLGATASLGTVVGMILYTASLLGSSIWLTAWSEDTIIMDGGTDAKAQTDMRLGGYAAFGIGLMVGVVLLSLSIFLGAVRASIVLHSQLLEAIVRAPMSFFDTTPLGRILNRFSKDMDNIDVEVPMQLNLLFFHAAFVLASFIAISYTTPIFMVLFVPLIIIFIVLQRLYICSVRQLQRIDSIQRSPIYSNFSETLAGTICIRAFNQSDRFNAKNDQLVDNSQISYYSLMICQRWLAVALPIFGAFIVLFAAVFAILERDSISAALAGMSVSYAQQAAMMVDQLIISSSTLETNFVSVERVKEYSQLTPEASWEIEHKQPSSNWPESGKVEFSTYSTRYRSGLDLVLRDISFSVHPGEKVGIVGRTGAGKSSMTLALFRIIEAAGGTINIDGVNISEIGLHDLRSKITIIPQDPVLFFGSLRRNLDPFSLYLDSELWTALEHAHLKTYVSGLSEGLNYGVGEGGEALSVGQRQLVCLARALLRKTKILVLDEATAAVDLETDDLIQVTIRSEFKECTVLTIAHRLNTILDYDRVMVLDKGEIKEYEPPSSLLQNESSIFYSLAKDANLV